MLYTVYCILYNVYYILYTEYSILYTTTLYPARPLQTASHGWSDSVGPGCESSFLSAKSGTESNWSTPCPGRPCSAWPLPNTPSPSRRPALCQWNTQHGYMGMHGIAWVSRDPPRPLASRQVKFDEIGWVGASPYQAGQLLPVACWMRDDEGLQRWSLQIACADMDPTSPSISKHSP